MIYFTFIIGCIMGSFLTLVAERLPKGMSIITPASHCTYCNNKLVCLDLIPLFSIILQKFHCRYCNKKISPLYFFSELLCGFIFSYSFSYESSQSSIHTLLFLLMAYVLSLTDIFYLIVEPKIFYSNAVFLCISHLYLGQKIHFLASLGALLSLSLLNLGKSDQIGGGDILLISFWGLLLGAFPLVILLFIASCGGILFIFFFNFFSSTPIKRVPFVPFLSISLFIVLTFF